MASPADALLPAESPAPERPRNGVGNGHGHRDSEAAARELKSLLSARAGERHLVALQDYPDPDAISSALAYREIARDFEIEVDVAYEGLISHPENLALVNLLELDLIAYHRDLELGEYDAAVFLDNQGTTTRLSSRLKEAGVPTLVVIDHHDPQNLLDPIFCDVRPVGAAATLLTQYLRSGAFFELDPGQPSHVHLATALMHGLQSETDGFIHAGRAEFEAAGFLSRYLDHDLLERVMCVQKSRGTMDTIQAALAKRALRGGFSIAGVGAVRWGDRDAIPQAADFLLTEDNVHTAIVYGMLMGEDGREFISGSLRTGNATLGVDAFLKRALGKDVRGRPYGGGRSRAGGFEIDLGFLSGAVGDRKESESKWALYDREIRRRLFDEAGLDERKAERREDREAEAEEGVVSS
jgi:nanoRNase/pAp phosphatase (c-di-AMP/oligoRNAs hydrolase)